MTTTKSALSRILTEVRGGETYTIVDRDVPVARIIPISIPEHRLAQLVAAGSVLVPEGDLESDELLSRPRPRLRGDASAVAAIVEERRADR